MLVVIHQVIDPQTKIVFSRMSDNSIFLKLSWELNHFNKSDFVECDRKLNLSGFTKNQIIEAFESRVVFLEKTEQNNNCFRWNVTAFYQSCYII